MTSPRRPAPTGPDRGIPDATVARLPVYLRALAGLVEQGVTTVSSEELATESGVTSAKLRKDLSHLGSYGTRGVGYDCAYLVRQISAELGLTQVWRVAIVGVGNLGHALANYHGLSARGLTVVALLDNDPDLVGEPVAGLRVDGMEQLEDVVRARSVSIGVVAVPAPAAQDVTDRLVASGVTGILTFAPVTLQVPAGVDVRRVDLATELQILAFHEQRKAAERELDVGPHGGLAAAGGAR